MAEREPETKKSAPRRLGRRIATLIVMSGIAYLIGVGLYSVIPQVFFPESTPPPDDLSCANGLNGLRDELLSEAGARVEETPNDPADLHGWLREWDRRHTGLESRCTGDEHDGWILLGQLRQRLEGTLERYDREEGELARAFDQILST